jgi:hypothetical protein
MRTTAVSLQAVLTPTLEKLNCQADSAAEISYEVEMRI